ncbi:hypothetical protein ABVT39_007916 [Epinephelus coioides]
MIANLLQRRHPASTFWETVSITLPRYHRAERNATAETAALIRNQLAPQIPGPLQKRLQDVISIRLLLWTGISALHLLSGSSQGKRNLKAHTIVQRSSQLNKVMLMSKRKKPTEITHHLLQRKHDEENSDKQEKHCFKRIQLFQQC